MTFNDEQREALRAALDESRVVHDRQGGRAVSYLEGWDVIAAANRIFGFDGWDYEVISVGIIGEWTRKRDDGDVAINLYEAKVAVTVGGVRRVDIGTNITSGNTPEAHETSVKGAVTDGLKRALRTFGDQFGNGLYEKPSNNHRAGVAQRTERRSPTPQAGGSTPPSRSTTNSAAEFGNVGDLLNWAKDTFGIDSRTVCGFLDVKGAADIKDFGAAAAAIREHAKQPVGAQ